MLIAKIYSKEKKKTMTGFANTVPQAGSCSQNVTNLSIKLSVEEIIVRIGFTERMLVKKCLGGWALG